MIGNVRDILVVDDVQENLQVLNQILKANGYKVRPVNSGKTALGIIERNPPDLILLDITMPDMDGYQVCQILKENDRFKEIPVIFISALSETFDKMKAFKMGGVDYITKPFQAEEVLSRIQSHLKIATLQNELKMHAEGLEVLVDKQIKQISEQQFVIIFALAKLAQTRDDATGKHLDRVGKYCSVLSEQLKKNLAYEKEISDLFIENIAYASCLHDIGKVAIPDAILLKPGPDRLNESETEIMKTHTTLGAETLKKIRDKNMYYDIFDMSYDIAYYHHEMWDGNGYPTGIKGTEIPLAARIMAVADVYDALKSERCYKGALPHEETLKEIRANAGTQFDPAIVEAFLQVNEKILEIWQDNV